MRGELRRAPAFRAALYLGCGILLADMLPAPGGLIPVPLLRSLFFASLLLLRFAATPAAGSLAPLLCLLTGLFLGARDRTSLPTLPEALLGERVLLTGRVEEILSSDPRQLRLLLTDASAGNGASFAAVPGAVRATLARTALPAPGIGTKVGLTGRLYPVSGPRNPGEYDLRRWAAANGIAGELMGRSPDTLVVLDPSPASSLRARAITPLRRHLLDLIERMIGGEEGELLKGLLFGERGGIARGVNDDFIRAGVAHVLAVSGSNVAVVAGFFAFLFYGLGRALRSALLALALVAYMLLAGAQPPVVRATIMALVAIASVAAGERINPLNALGIAALLILAFGSQTLFDAGFQLSFAAVLSLILLYPSLGSAIGALGEKSCRFVRGALRVMGVTAIATLGTLPLTAGVFGRISLIGIVANIVVGPATGLSVLLGGVMLLLAPLWGAVADLYAAANWGVLRFTLLFTHLCAAPSWASLDTPWFRPIHTLSFVALLIAACSWGNPERFRKALIAAAALVLLSRTGPSMPAGPSLRLTMLDVGQGDALLIGTPHGAHLLVDCGPASPASDAGRETILPFLAREGIDTLDWLLISHGHSDHVGGLRSLLSSGRVRALGAPAPLARRLAAETGREVIPLSAGDMIDADPAIRCQILWPARGISPGSDGNDASLVLRLQYGSTGFLLAGDAGMGVENVLVRHFGTFLRAECLKVAHHASLTSAGDEFLAKVAPRIALVSAGRNNRFRHPAEATLARLRAHGATVRRTDLDGATIVESDGSVTAIGR